MIDTNALFDDKTLDIPAPFINKFQVNRKNGIIRITFGEGTTNVQYRAAVTLSLEDANDLKDAIGSIINYGTEKLDEKKAEPIDQSDPTPPKKRKKRNG
jgi:hypothetical protein